jgi:ligand-binding sensor domain-containing protein
VAGACKDVPSPTVEPGNPEWRAYTRQNSGLVSDSVNTIGVTIQNEKWFGTELGLSRLNAQTWTTYTTSNSNLRTNRITAIAQGRDGSVWVGTAGGGLARYNTADPGGPWQTYGRAEGVPDEFIHGIAVNQFGDVFVATNGGVGRFTPASNYTGTWQTYTTNDGLPASIITAIAADSRNDIWVGTISSGAGRFDGSVWSTLLLPVGFQVRITSIAVDANNAKWFGTWDGAYRLTTALQWASFSQVDGLVDRHVNTAALDLQGNVWFGTDRGLSKFDGSRWTSFMTSNSGLISDLVNSANCDVRLSRPFCVQTRTAGYAISNVQPRKPSCDQ